MIVEVMRTGRMGQVFILPALGEDIVNALKHQETTPARALGAGPVG